MRHTICAGSVRTVRKTAAAPASRACRVGHAATARALVAPGGSTLCRLACLARACRAAVALATVAVAAQHDLATAARAQEEAGWTVHAHPEQTEVLDGRVPARHTAVAPPSSARCRARRGHQASRPERPLPCPPSSASGMVVAPWLRPGAANAPRPRQPYATAHQRRRPACLAALQGGQAGEQRSAERRAHVHTGASHDEAQSRAASSPPNSRGS